MHCKFPLICVVKVVRTEAMMQPPERFLAFCCGWITTVGIKRIVLYQIYTHKPRRIGIYCTLLTDLTTGVQLPSKKTHTHMHINMLAWKLSSGQKDSTHHYKPAASLLSPSPDPTRSMALWPNLPLLFWQTVKAIIHREKTRETLDSFTLLATDFHNSCPPTTTSNTHPLQLIHPATCSDWDEYDETKLWEDKSKADFEIFVTKINVSCIVNDFY